jgi:AcrR family transcriptional regulator
MKVSTSSTATASSAPAATPARKRLLAAAAEVFAEQGLMAATTRGIAEAAGVNEVTLFRQFGNKQNLLTAVIEEVFAAGPVQQERSVPLPEGAEGPLWQLMWDYAQFYRARLGRNVRLIRVLIGEIQHCDENARQIVRGVFLPQRQEFLGRVQSAQEQGFLRATAESEMVVDQLCGMILSSVLKSDMPMKRPFSEAHYLQACVETMVRAYQPDARKTKAPGISPAQGAKGGRR